MRVLCLPFSSSLAHVSRVLAVSEVLRERGHHVLMAGNPGRLGLAAEAGFPVLALHEPPGAELLGRLRRGQARFLRDAELAAMIEADEVLIRDVGPDLVLSDGRFSARYSARQAGIPHVALTNAMHTPYRAVPYLPVPAWLLPAERWLHDLAGGVFRRASRRQGVDPPVRADDCLMGNDLTLLADAPEFFPSHGLPETVCYIGPITWNGRLAPPAWWPPPGIVVYLTMGTTGPPEFFALARAALRDTPWSLVVSTGGLAPPDPPGDGVWAAEFLDGDLVAGVSSAVVCHGGSGTIYQALRQGKPVIGIPTTPGQRFNMKRVVALGVGAELSWNAFRREPRVLRELIRKIVSDRECASRCAGIAERLATYDAAASAAAMIEAMPRLNPLLASARA